MRHLAGWLFIGPALLCMAVFFALPLAAGLALSLTDFDIYALADLRNLRFVGLANYVALVQRPVFWTALANTALIVATGVPLSIGVSLAAALAVNSPLARCRTLFRTAYFAPVVTTLVGVAIIWKYLLHPRYGWFNHALSLAGLPVVDWLGDPRFSMPAIVIFSVWKNFGYNMVLFIAALNAIPAELHEVARLDGAGAWARFRHVTLPLMRPTMVMVGLMTTAGYFQLFAEPYVMTQGGPLQSTVTVLYLMYEEGFKWWNLGTAAAVALVLFVLTLAVTLLPGGLSRVQALREARRGAVPASVAARGALGAEA
jgi:multiple sugar transport system permease protein